MNLEQMLLHIKSDNEQDSAAAKQWWKEENALGKLAVWDKIQKEYSDPSMEVMSRLAQLKFGELLEELGTCI